MIWSSIRRKLFYHSQNPRIQISISDLEIIIYDSKKNREFRESFCLIKINNLKVEFMEIKK